MADIAGLEAGRGSGLMGGRPRTPDEMKRLAGNPGRRPLSKPELVTKENAEKLAAGLAEVDASPGARALALEHSVDLKDLTGTGKGGKVLKADVERALEKRGAGRVRMPSGLTKGGKKVWEETAPIMTRIGILKPINAMLFGALCDIMARIEHYKKILETDGEFYHTGTGQIKRHPAKSSLQADEREARHMAAAFGITPAAAGRVAESMATLPLFGADNDPEQDQKNPIPADSAEKADGYFGY